MYDCGTVWLDEHIESKCFADTGNKQIQMFAVPDGAL